MVPVRPLAIHPSRFGYVTGGLALLLDAIIVVIFQLRGLVHRPSEAALAALIVDGIALYGLNDLLVAAVARIAVDDGVVEVRASLAVEGDSHGRRSIAQRGDRSLLLHKGAFIKTSCCSSRKTVYALHGCGRVTTAPQTWSDLCRAWGWHGRRARRRVCGTSTALGRPASSTAGDSRGDGPASREQQAQREDLGWHAG